MEKIKENVLNDYKQMIYKSWTYAKLTKNERQQLEQTFESVTTRNALKGTYTQRWEILQAIYSSFLYALYYTPDWREDKENVRRCSECGEVMKAGYCINDGDEYFCGGLCLAKNYKPEEYAELYDNGRAYWTQWDN